MREKFITRAWADGTDFIGTDLHREKNKRAGRRGFGDMICEVSNLYAQSKDAEVLCPFLHSGHKKFCSMIDMKDRKYFWSPNGSKHNHYISMSKDNESLCNFSESKLLHCYPDYDYVKLDESKFLETEIPKGDYITCQSKPNAKKCNYERTHIQKALKQFKKQFGMEIIEVGGKESLGMEKIAYLIKHSKYFVGIDSGMTHFANTVKEKSDVHIVVPEDRITGVSWRWINQGYNVKLV